MKIRASSTPQTIIEIEALQRISLKTDETLVVKVNFGTLSPRQRQEYIANAFPVLQKTFPLNQVMIVPHTTDFAVIG